MRLFKPFEFPQITLFFCTLYISSVSINGGKTRSKLVKERTLHSKRAAGIIDESEQYRRSSHPNREHWGGKQRFHSWIRPVRDFEDCTDCKGGKETRSLTQPHKTPHGIAQPPKISARISVVKKSSRPRQQWIKSDGYTARAKKVTNRLGRRARKLENDWKWLNKKLIVSVNKNSMHKTAVNTDLGVNKAKPAQREARLKTNRNEHVGKEESILLKTVRAKSYNGTHQYDSKIKAHSRTEPKQRPHVHALIPPLDKTLKSGHSEAIARDQGWASLHDNGEGGSSYWAADGTGGEFGGNKLVRPVMADILENPGTSLLTSIHSLRRHANNMMKAFIASQHQLGDYYQVIVNGTMKTILPGAREATEVIYTANEYILDATKRAYQVRARESVRAHMKSNRQRNSSYPVDSYNKSVAIVEQMELRNFYDKLRQAETREEEILLFAVSVNSLESKSTQETNEAKRLRRLFDERDYFTTVRELRDNLNDAVRTMNTDIFNRPALRRLSYLRRLLDSTHNVLSDGANFIAQSVETLTSSMANLEKNRQLFNKWLVRQRRSKYAMDSQQLSELKRLRLAVTASTAHSRDLWITAERDFRELIASTNQAKEFLLQPAGRGATSIKLQSEAKNLQNFIPEMYSVLEEIGNLTGSKIDIRRPQKCTPAEAIEGSGDGGEIDGTDDEVLTCVDESDTKTKTSSVDESDTKTKTASIDDKSKAGGTAGTGFFSWLSGGNAASDDDFTFEESESTVQSVEHQTVLPTNNKKQDMNELNQDVKAYTATLLKHSQELFDSAKPLNISYKSLQENWQEIQEDVNSIEKTLGAHKALKKELEEMAKETMSVTSRIEQLENLPSLLRLNNMIRTAKRVERKYLAAATGKEDPKTGWQDDYYTFDEDYFYDNDDENKRDSFEKVLKQRDAAAASYEDLHRKGQQIQENHNDIVQRLQSLSGASCGRVSRQLVSVHTNLTALRQKVMQARTILSSMQLSVSKKGKGHFAFPIKSSPNEYNDEQTSVRLCIRPTSLDGPVLVVQGNESASYTFNLDEGVLTASVYDANWNFIEEITMDSVLEKDTWYTLQIQRLGFFLAVSIQQRGKESEFKSVQVNALHSIKSKLAMVFLGGVPANIDTITGSWEGCFGDLSINGRSLNLFTLDSEGQRVSLCDSHCLPRTEPVSTVFNGDGFLHYSKLIAETVMSIAFNFSSHQQNAALFSIVNNTKGFSLHVMLEKGSLKVQRSSDRKSTVYLSSDKGYGDGKSHKIKVEVDDSTTHITVDGKRDHFHVKSNKPDMQTESLWGISMGAFVSIERQFQPNMPRPLIGCISNVSVNGEMLLLSDAEEMYNVYRGSCADIKHQFWHACYQWSNQSSRLMFEDIPDSKTISLWVSYNATGPLLAYVRADDFTLVIVLEEEGLDVSYKGSSQILKKPKDFKVGDFFTLKVVDSTDKSCVEVIAWEQTIENCYGGWFWPGSESQTLHTIVLGGLQQINTSGKPANFLGSLSQLMIENRFIDLSQFKESNKIEACQRALTQVQPRIVKEIPAYKSVSCSKPDAALFHSIQSTK